jgi:hypothetical protein
MCCRITLDTGAFLLIDAPREDSSHTFTYPKSDTTNHHRSPPRRFAIG